MEFFGLSSLIAQLSTNSHTVCEEAKPSFLLESIIYSYSDEKTTINCLTTQNIVAKIAREYIIENHHKKISMEDICQQTGYGVRTIQRAVIRRFGYNISNLIATVRLNSTYKELLYSDTRNTTVTQVDLNNRMLHFGRFSALFKARFGESPSSILAK